jgi:hypothetical protein
VPDEAPVWPLIIAKPLQNRCKTKRRLDGGRLGADGGPTGAKRGARREPDGARRDGGWKDYLLLKEKMTCSVYVSCKSSSASDVSNAEWM